MGYHVRKQELISVSALPPAKRYRYFLGKVADWGELWSLGDEDGWALTSGPDDQTLIPVWPAEAFAAICATGKWSAYVPKEIPIEDWLEKCTPGMIGDRRKVAVFPTIDDVAIVLDPAVFAENLREALAQYE